MDDAEQTEFYRYDSTDDTEYDETEDSPSRVKRALSVLAELALAAAAGYLLGWAVSVLLDRFAK